MRAICVFLASSLTFLPLAHAQTGVGVGIGVGSGTANATSNAGNSQATGQGGSAASSANGGSAGVTFNNNGGPANTRSDQTLDQTLTTRGGTVNRQTGGLRNVPAVFAPGLAAAGLETCLGSVSGGGSFMGGGFSFGTTVPDAGCAARLDSRTLWSMGLKKAAVARLCLTSEINRSMPEVCAEYLPQSAQVGLVPGPAAGAPRLEPRYEAPVPVRGQRTLVLERASGRERACDDFDGRRCLRWSR